MNCAYAPVCTDEKYLLFTHSYDQLSTREPISC